jgi:hypothetical protein
VGEDRDRWTLKPQRTLNTLQQQKSENDAFKRSLPLFVFFCGFSVPLRLQRPMQIFPT